jgi:hypothetical protein
MNRAALSSPRIVLLWVVIAAASACSTTRIIISGEVETPSVEADRMVPSRLLRSLRGELRSGTFKTGARVIIDPHFEAHGFAQSTSPLLIIEGDQAVLSFTHQAPDAHARLYIALAEELLVSRGTISEGDFIPYLQLAIPLEDASGEPRAFTAVCKGGRGRVSIDPGTGPQLRGTLAIVVSCRTYVDGHEREESDLELSGHFRIAGEPSARNAETQ